MKARVFFVLLIYFLPLVNVAQNNETGISGAKVRKVEVLKKSKLPRDWHFRCAEEDSVYGADIYRAYDYLKGRKQKAKTIVAIIDSGVEVTHQDLKDNLWINRGEISENGIDDDNNGYVDDVHGWNFLGHADGRQIRGTQVADWEFLRLQEKYTNVDTMKLSRKGKNEYRYFTDIVCRFSSIAPFFSSNKDFTKRYVARINELREERLALGDDVNSLKERHYGNNNLLGKDSEHGTHVAGIVGATRGDGVGIDGVADVELMILKVLDGGDEEDKDVASAIYYAVDHGARVINMSFTKYFSPNKKLVDKAMRYAERKGVLIVKAAGNDSCPMDKYTCYPNQFLRRNKVLKNFICVGSIDASGLVSSFSNYGKKEVDIFAPGCLIFSTVLDNKYKRLSGTSMAAPVVTGVIALIWNYFPELTMKQVKRAVLEGVTSWKGCYVSLPQMEESMMTLFSRGFEEPKVEKMVDFGELCTTGGILNALQAVKIAERMAGE